MKAKSISCMLVLDRETKKSMQNERKQKKTFDSPFSIDEQFVLDFFILLSK